MTFKEFIELYDDFVYEGLRQCIFPWVMRSRQVQHGHIT